jgi:predicted glycoside hydrolase/deacetylase ChbG (UPF0249 family)
MTVKRLLIVNADDFGQSPGVNRGIIQAHEQGIVTSASLMVRWPAAREAALYARGRLELSLGLHVDLGEWRYQDGAWVSVYEVVSLEDHYAVAGEVKRQLDMFRRLADRNPTHLDSHQHVHRWDPVHSILMELSQALGIPLRHYSPPVRYCGDFYGQDGTGTPYPEGISIERLLGILTALPPGLTELGCHPGDGGELDSMYRAERVREVETLCSSRIRAALVTEGIELSSFHEASLVEGRHT